MTHSPAMTYKVDVTAHSGVALCKVCDARFLVSSKEVGLRMLADHCTASHPGYENTPRANLRTTLSRKVRNGSA